MLRNSTELGCFFAAGAVVLVGMCVNEEVGGAELLVLCADERLDRYFRQCTLLEVHLLKTGQQWVPFTFLENSTHSWEWWGSGAAAGHAQRAVCFMQSLVRIASTRAIQGSLCQFSHIVPTLVGVCNSIGTGGRTKADDKLLVDSLVQVLVAIAENESCSHPRVKRLLANLMQAGILETSGASPTTYRWC